MICSHIIQKMHASLKFAKCLQFCNLHSIIKHMDSIYLSFRNVKKPINLKA
uniref:Uncharacterized protein n=1 Tax=Rhizophora mucronata TaxID=61149 RepID=A0A2P2MAN0_RHIMU